MNNKQINELQNNLLKLNSWTEEEKKFYSELSCRTIIDSNLVYETNFFDSEYCNEYIAELGETRVKELYQEQLEYFNTCIIISNVFKDSSGLSYNAVVEPNEDGYIYCEVVQEPIMKKTEDTNEINFSVKIGDEYKCYCVDIELPSDLNDDYSDYYVGRKIGVKVVRNDVGEYKAVEVKFLDKNNEYEM